MQVLPAPLEISAYLIQMPDAPRGYKPLFQGLQWITAIGAGVRYIVGDGRPAGKRDIVANGDVGGDDGIAARDELPSDLGRSSHHEARREKAILSKVAVVRNMTNVVQLGPGSNMSRRQSCAIDRAVAADFHAVADFDVAQMRNLSRPAVGIHRIAKAVAADTGARMNLAIFAEPAGPTNKNMRVQDAASADLCVTFDDAV